MPHFILEHSSNIVEDIEPEEFFHRLHSLLTKLGPFELSAIRSRIISHDKFLIADGQREAAFVHLTLQILDGRPLEIRKVVSKRLLEFLEEHFQESCLELGCKLSVEVREMDRETYSKG